MHQPRSGVVSIECQDHKAALAGWPVARHKSHISSWWIFEVQRSPGGIAAIASSEDVVIVTMQVQGMRQRDR